MHKKPVGPGGLSTRWRVAPGNDVSSPAAPPVPSISTLQYQLGTIGVGLFALFSVLIALMVWSAEGLVPMTPWTTLLLWMLVFVALLAGLVSLIRALTRLPRFQRANRACAARHLQMWMPGLRVLLSGDEDVVGAVYAPCFNRDGWGYGWINALLIWTDRRLLLVPAFPSTPAAPIWSLRLNRIASIRVSRLRGGWLWWLQGPIEQIEITEGNGLRTCIVAGVPGDSPEIVCDLLRTARYQDW